jgi:ribonuclease BN (tRNA processing enzyme)
MTSLTFLGTAGDALVVGKQLKSSAGIVLKTQEIQLHLDPGPGCLNRMKETSINARETSVIVLSNPTLKRSHDVNAIVSAMTMDGLDRRGIAVLGRENQFLIPQYREYLERIIYINDTKRLALGDVEIEISEARKEGHYHFKFLTPNLSIGYITETGYDSNLAKIFEDTNVLIINCKNPPDVKEDDALNLDDVRTIAAKVKPKLLIITGFGIKMLDMDFLETARELQRSLGIQTLFAIDGIRIEPTGYARMSQQRTLNRF